DATSYNSARKHVSRACLECRKRHTKCDGELPRCRKCVKLKKECTYVQSHRGGSRKKGVLVTKKPSANPALKNEIPDIEDIGTFQNKGSLSSDASVKSLTSPLDVDAELVQELDKLPCADPTHKCDSSNCATKKVFDHFKGRPATRPLSDEERETIQNLRKKAKLHASVKKIDGLFSENGVKRTVTCFEDLKLQNFYTNYSNLVETDFYDKESILKNYYTTFHKPHPLLPQIDQLEAFFVHPSIEKEMMLLMKVIGDGQTTSKYSKNLDVVSDVILQCLNLIRENKVLDIVSVQVLLLTSIVAHVSSLHVLSRDLRHFCIYLTTELEIHLVDGPNTPKFVQCPRTLGIPHDLLYDSARRIYWELYFFDVIMGSADGKTLTSLSKIDATVNFPTTPSREIFDYDGRSKTGHLVSEAIEMNQLILSKKPIEAKRSRLRSNLSSWEMKLGDPKLFNAPPLVNKNGRVNEGVHQSILLFNYASVFAYRPFSNLWKINSPQNPQCGVEEGLTSKHMTPQIKSETTSSIIDTRKTIQAADSIVELLINTNSSKVVQRTPVFACALALSSLVHVSAYIWEEQVLNDKKGEEEGITPSDLETVANNIKLTLSAIYPISQHWILSGKLAKHIRESLSTLRPQLYTKLKEFLPDIEVSVVKENDSMLHKLPNAAREHYDNNSLNVSSESPSVTSESSNSQASIRKRTLPSIQNLENPIQTPSAFINTINENDFFSDPLNGYVSPVSDTGCDWIDKALVDFFDTEEV
ncbi:MADS box transcription factor, partial [Suhomyces tanzawaensis NRRL Y-17324]